MTQLSQPHNDVDAPQRTKRRDIIFHVGYEKTGTTFLQRGFFRYYKALGKESLNPEAKPISRQLGQYVREDGSEVWQTSEAQSLAERMIRASDRDPILYSSEHWTCAPFFEAQFPVVPPRQESHRVTEHLRDFARYAWRDTGRVRAIVTIRRQPDYLASLYAQRSCHFRASQQDFERRVQQFLDDASPHGWVYIDYHRLHEDLTRILGRENVLFLPFEEVGQQQFWDALVSFCDLSPFDEQVEWKTENARRVAEDRWQLRSRRFMTQSRLHEIARRKLKRRSPARAEAWTQFCKRLENRLSWQQRRVIMLERALRDRVLRSYEPSNRAMARAIGKDLSALGYY